MLVRAGSVLGAVGALGMFVVPGAAGSPLPWAPPPMNSCGEVGFDSAAREPDPNVPVPPPSAPAPPRIAIPLPYPQFVPIPIPEPSPDNTRVDSPLPADPCANPCPDLTDVAHESDPGPSGSAGSGGSAGSSDSAGSSGSAGGSAQLGLPEIHINPEAEPVPIPVPGPGPWPDSQPVPPPAAPAREPGPTAAPVSAPVVGDVELVGQLTGHGSENRTDKRWQVMGTDLGIVWESRPGEVAMAFGDTIGAGPRSGNPDWRSNTLAHSTDRNLADGMHFDSMVSDSRCHAAELLTSRKVSNYEITTVPTSGFAVGDRQYLSYMSVARWAREPGRWWTNYGGIAWSDDNGQTWTKSQHAQWHNFFGLGQFQVTAMVPHGDYVYMFGTPNGRFGSIGLARVPLDQVLNKSAYQYWMQGDWAPVQTALGSNTATPIADGSAGEISVRFDADTHLWQMSYLDVSRGAIVLRNAASPQGIWSAPVTLIDQSVYPQVYGGFIHPWSTGTHLYVLISEWQNYNVHLMHARIVPQP